MRIPMTPSHDPTILTHHYQRMQYVGRYSGHIYEYDHTLASQRRAIDLGHARERSLANRERAAQLDSMLDTELVEDHGDYLSGLVTGQMYPPDEREVAIAAERDAKDKWIARLRLQPPAAGATP
jgi:hypothetical protein